MSCKDVCVYVGDYDGLNEFYSEAIRKARKPYKCCECGNPIAVGDQYERVSGKYDGEIFSERTCLPCVEIRKAFACGGWVCGELWESIRDQLFPSWDAMQAIDCLAKLTTDAAMAKMKVEYAKFREDTP